MKTLTVRQMAAIKRVAQNVNSLVEKKNRIANKLIELNKEHENLTKEIEIHEGGVKALTDGFTSEEIVIKKVIDTGKLDKDGRSVKITKYVPRDYIVFNEETRLYELPECNNEIQDCNFEGEEEIENEVSE